MNVSKSRGARLGFGSMEHESPLTLWLLFIALLTSVCPPFLLRPKVDYKIFLKSK